MRCVLHLNRLHPPKTTVTFTFKSNLIHNPAVIDHSDCRTYPLTVTKTVVASPPTSDRETVVNRNSQPSYPFTFIYK
ncbi:hypothetical protein HanRHA438_Chr11g0499021 [Helianthus annuus]|nr:hypothetical protein HanRHA438_Chr11g0499021 [Helianthus annuus]